MPRMGSSIQSPPVTISDDVGAYLASDDTFASKTLKTLISHTVITQNKKLNSVTVTSAVQSVWTLELNSVVIASGRTGVSRKDSTFNFGPARPVVISDTIELKYQATFGPASYDVESYIQLELD